MLSFTEIGQFQKIVGGLIELVDELAKEAETEKMKVSLIKLYVLISQSFETPGCSQTVAELILVVSGTIYRTVCASVWS